MNRLTRKNGNAYILRHPECPDGVPTNYQSEQGYYMVLQRLAEYEDLEERGLLVRKTCSWSDEIGDTHSTGKYRVCSVCGYGAFIPYFTKEGLNKIDYKYCPTCGSCSIKAKTL